MRWFNTLPIRRKLTWVVLTVSSVVLLMAATAIAGYEVFDFRRALARDTTVLADVVATNVSGMLAFEDEPAGRAALGALRSEEHVVAAVIYNAAGAVFVDYVRAEAQFPFPARPDVDGAEFGNGGLNVFRPIIQNERRLGTLYVRVDLRGLTNRLMVFSAIVLVILGVSVLIAAVLTARLQRPITEPILELAETARIISEQKDFSVRAKRSTGGEVGVLTTAFNEMLARIEERRAALMAANEQLRAEVAERQAAEARVTAQAARLAQLNHITRGIAERQDVESVFQAVVVNLEDHLPVDFTCVCLYDAEREQLTVGSVGARSGPMAEELAMTRGAIVSVDQNGLGRCVRGELVYEPNTLAIPMPFPRRLSGVGLRSLVIAPLLVESRVFGVLVSARRREDAFSSGDCEFLKQLSEHVALAAHQTQLYAALQKAYDDLRQTQQAIMQQERLRALGQMASGIAHDINNAISPVSLYIESMLEKEPNLSTQTRERLTIVQRAIDDVAHTVSRMREFYRQRIPDTSMVRIDLNRIVGHVADLTKARWFDMPQQRGVVIDLKRDLAGSLPMVKGVESEIREALTNLVFNAVDSMNRGGVLTIRTRVLERANKNAPSVLEPSVAIEVADTGTGMSEETLRRCMEPFFTTKGERGTGLGLAMVYGIVQRHGAALEIESKVGIGTTVRMVFAVAPGSETFVDAPTQAPAEKLRILIIDDDPLLLKSLRDILESDGHTIATTGGGQDGINTFVDAAIGSEPFHVVITDLGMPYVDGRRVAAAVKKASPDTPVFLLTGWGNRLLAEGDVPAEVDRILSKPPKLRELREALAAVKVAVRR